MSTAIVQQVKHLPQAQQEMAVSTYLEQARDRLADALERTGPESVAEIRAEVATAAEATKQLGLSKEIRDDSTEMVRRAEYALGKAIRKGQEEGTVAKRGSIGGVPTAGVRGSASGSRRSGTEDLASSGDFFGNGQEQHEVYAIADGAETVEDFESALSEARAEGNLSRVNVKRKVEGRRSAQTRQQRADLVADMARQGYRSSQMVKRIGVSEGAIRKIARDFDIDIPADRVTAKSRRVDSSRVLSGVTESLSAAAYSLQQIDPLDLDQDQAQEWVDSLTESLSAIRKALNPIKESLRG